MLSAYGMDVGFYSYLGAYPLATRCAILADLGYQATNLTLWSEPAWADLPGLKSSAEYYGLDVAAIYLTVDLAAPLDAPETQRALRAIEQAGSTPVEVTLRFSDERHERSSAEGDGTARRFLDGAIAEAQRVGGELRLYPHYAFWMERVDDVIRQLGYYESPTLGMTFPAFHVYALEGDSFFDALRRARPFVRGVNTNGSRRLSGQYFPATIEPVGDGDFDNFAFLGELRSWGYDGTLGVQAYGIGGDPYVAFGRSLAAIRDIEMRLTAHPDWARLRSDTL